MHVITLEWSLQSRRRFEWGEKTGTFSSGIKKRFYNIRKIQISNFNSNFNTADIKTRSHFNLSSTLMRRSNHTVCDSILGRSVRTEIEMKKFTCHWWPCSILVLLHYSLFFKMTNRQQKKNKRSTSYIKMRQMYQAYAHTFDFFDTCIF